ncbi:MAG TPA: hypothetical protein VHM90_05035 [Phycisphaerae bacterium]|nr:hypothetical protein [Phycisphaerae bacterium]
MAKDVECPGCGKGYPFKPEIAGRRVKCRCGGEFRFPMAAPVEDESEVVPAQDLIAGQTACARCGAAMALGAAICTECGYSPRTGQVVPTRVVVGRPEAPRGNKAGVVLLILGIVFVLGFLVLVAGGIAAWWYFSQSAQNKPAPVVALPGVPAFSPGKFEPWRRYLPDNTREALFYDVDAIRGSPLYGDPNLRPAFETIAGRDLMGNHSLDDVRLFFNATGVGLESITFYEFSADQREDRIFEGGRMPAKIMFGAATAYRLESNGIPNGRAGAWIDARHLVVGSNIGVLQSVLRRGMGAMPANGMQNPALTTLLDGAGNADLMQLRNIGPALSGPTPRATLMTAVLGNDVRTRIRCLFGDPAAALNAANVYRTTHANSRDPAIRSATITVNGSCVDMDGRATYDEMQQFLRP